MQWMVGITTVPSRKDTLLPRTLASLRAGGFEDVRLFVDGDRDDGRRDHLATFRWPAVGAFGNFVLGLWEIFLRSPKADRFAMFQDDLVCVRNLRQHLEATTTQSKTYWNCYTFSVNERVIAGQRHGAWHEAALIGGANNRNLQTGKGALGLVFTREGVQALLSSPHLAARPVNFHGDRREKTNLDGAVVNAMNHAGFREMVHCPSLLRHTGVESTLATNLDPHTYPPDATFPGEGFDALEFPR